MEFLKHLLLFTFKRLNTFSKGKHNHYNMHWNNINKINFVSFKSYICEWFFQWFFLIKEIIYHKGYRIWSGCTQIHLLFLPLGQEIQMIQAPQTFLVPPTNNHEHAFKNKIWVGDKLSHSCLIWMTHAHWDSDSCGN